MDETNRSIAKRQVARLLGGSSNPICVISEQDTLVFANEAMANFVGRSVDALLGLQCGSANPDDGIIDAELSAFLSLPILWSRKTLKLLPESGAISGIVPPKTKTADTFAASGWIRCLIPLEEVDGCVLCIFCPNANGMSDSIIDQQSSITQKIIRENRAKFHHLDDMWFLQGNTAAALRVLEQVQLAIANPLPFTVFGKKGSGRSWLAQTIHSRRRSLDANEPKFVSSDSLIRINCTLMDVELLQSMFEVVVENKNKEAVPPTVLLDNLESLAPECISILASFLKANESIVCIATCDEAAVPSMPMGELLCSQILSRTSIIRIDLPALDNRLEDIPTLISSWFISARKKGASTCEICASFLDAISAYAWPGDIEEFDTAMTYATKSASQDKLTDKDLPVNIRTLVSHIEQTQADDSIDLDSILEDVERTMILRAMERYPHNKNSAAKILNISRARLLRRLQQWGIQSDSGSSDGDDDVPVFKEVK